MATFNLQKELIIRTIKIIDIGYIAILYFISAYFLGYYLDSFFVYLYGIKYETKTQFILLLEILSQIIAIGIVTYIVKNLIELIPFPLNGISGFDHQRVKELKSAGFFTVFIVIFQTNFQNKLSYVKDLLQKHTNMQKNQNQTLSKPDTVTNESSENQ